MNILGVSCFYHDSAAALVVDGRLTAAASQERFSRIKHDSEIPVEAARFCLDKAGLTIADIDWLVFYDKPLTKFERIVTGYMAEPVRSYRAVMQALPIWLGRKLWTEQALRKAFEYKGEILYTPHHLAHAAGTFFCSAFEKAAVLTIDGVGEWSTASWGIGENNHVELKAQMSYPHSVGLLYSAFTYYLGFMVNSAEYKIMGLAPFGTPRYAELIEEELVRIFDDGSIALNLDMFTFQHGLCMTGRRFDELFGRSRRTPDQPLEDFHQDIAASLQLVTEKIVRRQTRHVRKQTGLSHLCLSGGVALNCSATGKLLKEQIFDDIYIQPAAGDAGGAVGAALYVAHTVGNAPRQPQPFFGLGPSYENDQIKAFLDCIDVQYSTGSDRTLARTVAKRIAEGAIVGIFHGAMEFGPRALGFRSILADPRDPEMKAKINRAVKYREPFRPFAPAVMRERVSDWFDCEGDSPYMTVNFNVHEDKRALIPAVTHVDGTARIQTVAEPDNPMLHAILQQFEDLTGVPVLLNTSFNLRGHPIVNTPEEAFATFCSGGIDLLLIGSYLIDKQDVSAGLVMRYRTETKSD